MGNIQTRVGKDGKKSYRVLIRRIGQPLQTMTFVTMTAAKKWERDTESQIDKGKVFQTSPSKQKTVADMIDRYIENTLPNKGVSSQVNQKKHLEWWKDEVGQLKLSQLTRAVIVEKRDFLASSSFKKHNKVKKYKPATVNRYLDALSATLTEAVYKWGWLEVHPMRGYVLKLVENNERTRYLSKEEQVNTRRFWKLLTHAKTLFLISKGERKFG